MMATDLQDLEQTVQTYFDGLYEGDTAKLASVFHDESHLFSVTDGKLDDMPRAKWFELVNSRPSARSRDLPRRDWVVHIDRSGPTTAFAKVHCQIPPRYFTDYLTLVKLADGWKVISKTFHTETR
jgi:Putative lumazine-binding